MSNNIHRTTVETYKGVACVTDAVVKDQQQVTALTHTVSESGSCSVCICARIYLYMCIYCMCVNYTYG